jgi:hypothetical protein
MQLLTLKQPVRCKKCNTRVFASRSYARWLRKQEINPAAGVDTVTDAATESVAE